MTSAGRQRQAGDGLRVVSPPELETAWSRRDGGGDYAAFTSCHVLAHRVDARGAEIAVELDLRQHVALFGTRIGFLEIDVLMISGVAAGTT